MLLDIVTQGTTDYSCQVRVVDSTDGTPETSVAYDTPGVDLWYRRPGAAHSSITEADLAAETTAHTDGGFLHISDGYCRLDLPDAAVASGVDYVDVGGTFTGMIVIGGRIKLASATRGLSGTALPDAAAGSAGGLPDDTDANGRVRIVDGTAAGELDTVSGGVILADSASHGGSSTVLTADHIIVDSTADHALYLNANASGKHALYAYAEGANGDAARWLSTSGRGFYVYTLSGIGFQTQGGGANPGWSVEAGAGETPGMRIWAGTTGASNALELMPAGTGKPIADDSNNYVGVDIQSIHDDATAALNAEAAFDGTGYNVGNGNIVSASVTGNVSGSVNSLNTQAKADVNAEIVDALATDTYDERAIGAGPPAANSPLTDKIEWLFMLARNKMTSDGSTQTLFDDAGTGTVSTSSISDAAGTTTRGEYS